MKNLEASYEERGKTWIEKNSDGDYFPDWMLDTNPVSFKEWIKETKPKKKKVNRLIYDIEIINAIPTKEPRIEGIEYCKSWGDFEGMGIAVIGYKWNDEPADCAYNAESFLDVLRFYDDDEHQLVGFNSLSFDDKLLAAHGLEGIETHYDLLEQVRIAAGFKAHFQSVPRGYSYKLDALAKANGMAKTGSGALAPVLWQQGERQSVIDYCLHDCEITAAILDMGLAGELIDPNTGNKLQLAGLPE